MTKERIQKLLAQANVASRRASEELISAGRVRVNDVVAKLGDKADPETDTITVDGTRLKFDDQQRTYIALNKPKQILSTTKPHKGDNRQTVGDLIGSSEHLFSIGRLDADSEGLVVMTNDGDLAFRLTHPRYRHSKTYRVEVIGLPTAETMATWQQGIVLEDGKTSPCKVEIVKGNVKGTILRIVMTEGKKRQIRRVGAALGHPVTRLTRTHIGMFALGDLAPGQWREMTAKEVMLLKTPAPEIKSLRGQVRGQGWRFANENSAAPAEDEQRSPVRPARRNSSDRPPKRRPGGTRTFRKASTDVESAESSADTRPGRRNSTDRPPKRRPGGSRTFRKALTDATAVESSADTRPAKRRPTGKRSTTAESSEQSSERPPRASKKRVAPHSKSGTDRRGSSGNRSTDQGSAEGRPAENTPPENRPRSDKKRISPRPKSGTGGKPSNRSSNRSNNRTNDHSRSRKGSPR